MKRTWLAVWIVLILLGLARFCSAQDKPLNKDEVLNLVMNRLSDETGAKAVKERGIDFEPTEEFLQSLKDMGAEEVFIAALRSARRSVPSSPTSAKPLNRFQILELLANGVASQRIATLVEQRGIDFKPSNKYLEDLRLIGAEDVLLKGLQSGVPTVGSVQLGNPQAQVAQARQAEEEFRGALQSDPGNAGLHFALAGSLDEQRKSDEAIAEYRQVIQLKPGFAGGHESLGSALRKKGDLDGAIAEFRESVRLDPMNSWTRIMLANTLEQKGIVDEAAAEYREALRQDPNNAIARVFLGNIQIKKGDLEGAIAQYSEALRLNPHNDLARIQLGAMLEQKGDTEGAMAVYRTGIEQNPRYYLLYNNLGVLLARKGDVDGAITEFREAVRLVPTFAPAHYGLGLALGRKGDVDGAAFVNAYWTDAFERCTLRCAPRGALHARR